MAEIHASHDEYAPAVTSVCTTSTVMIFIDNVLGDRWFLIVYHLPTPDRVNLVIMKASTMHSCMPDGKLYA